MFHQYDIIECLRFKQSYCSFTVFTPEQLPHVLDRHILMSSQFLVSAEGVDVVKTVLPEGFRNNFLDRLAELNLLSGEVRPAVEYETKFRLIIVLLIHFSDHKNSPAAFLL